ncbi:Shufflon-specific DNA recombinase [Pseudomonas orientalis]|uniref:hypothetical protein n=1 Tax=Pseudomonas orientalis TaxID=76758 RepID=UPI000F713EC6|nr:hypothetical protein [Pseudomonas orientalis]AZE92338.1 Shufflon-specific DNA recombinase [Pseudomonas orientalis]
MAQVMPQEDFLINLRFHDLWHEATCRLATKLPNLIELASVTGHRDGEHAKAVLQHYGGGAS